MAHWTSSDIPSLNGRLALITGANSGIGYESALALAAHGARLILAVRSLTRGDQAAAAIRSAHPDASVEVMALDLSDLGSVRHFADAIVARAEPLPLLINNAGVMALPYRRTTDGFEMQFGTNHLGHFALTGRLLPALLAAPHARVVTVSSGVHLMGSLDFDNLDGARGYDRWRAYAQSKLANLLFAYELQRRFEAAGASAISVACHPGYAATNLLTTGARMEGSSLGERLSGWGNRLLAQPAARGALPTLYAATAEGVQGGDYIGPGGLGGLRGYPVRARSSALSYDRALAEQLWARSEALTGVRYL